MKKILFFFLVLLIASFSNCSKKHYTIVALFENVDAIESGADVRIKGLPVGKVTDMTLFRNKISITLTFPNSVNIPKNSKFEIDNPLVGSPWINIEPSEDNHYLQTLDTVIGSSQKSESIFNYGADSLSTQKRREAINKIKEGLNELLNNSKDTTQFSK